MPTPWVAPGRPPFPLPTPKGGLRQEYARADADPNLSPQFPLPPPYQPYQETEDPTLSTELRGCVSGPSHTASATHANVDMRVIVILLCGGVVFFCFYNGRAIGVRVHCNLPVVVPFI